MIKRLISFLLVLCLLIAIPLSALYKYNPFTRKLDYYEPVSGADLGDLGDVTLTGLATGDILYYSGAAWINLNVGANGEVLTLAAGLPSWAAAGAPAAHAASHEVGGGDLVDHDQLTNYLAAQHLTLPNTIVAVLTDHNKVAHDALLIDADTVDGEHAAAIVTNARVKAHFPDTIANILSDHNLLAHTALGLFDASSDVDHNATTNYDANRHTDHTAVSILSGGLITGGGTIDGNQTLTLTEATIEAAIDSLPNLTQMATPWTNVFVVDAGGGGDYATIQAALNAQNAGGETFLVAPGTYAADTISFTATDQVVKPLGHAANVIVTQADANIVDGGAFTDCIVEGIEIRLTAPTTAINAIQVGTGSLTLMECRGYLATAVALVQADQPALVGFTDAGMIRIERGNYQYYHTGVCGGAAIKATFRANFNLAELHLHKIDVITIINSGTAAVTSLFVTTGTALTEMHNAIDCTITDPNATLVVGLGYVGGAGAHNVQGNHVDVIATANVGYGLYHNGTATVRSGFNAIHVQDTGGTSYAFYVGASATLNSHFDDLRSDDGNSIAGTLNLVSSETDGDFTVTNAFVYDRVTDHNLFVGYLAGEDIAGGGQYNTLIGEQAGLNVTTGDDNTFVGYQAGFLFTDRTANTFIGARAGYGASGPTEAHSNVAVGMEALYSLGYDGGSNVAVGYKAAYSLDDGPNNVAIGAYAGYGMDSTGGKNIFIGAESGYTVGRKYENVVVGYYGMYDATTASYNVVIGAWAGQRITTGQYNTIVGFRAAGRLTTVAGFDLGNVAIGHSAMNQNVVGIYNVAIGKEAGYGISAQSYSENVFVGYRAAYQIKTATADTFIGAYAGYTMAEGDGNVAVGHKALYGNSPDSDTKENVAVGTEALYTLGYAGSRNVAVGYKALRLMDYESRDNVAIGWNAGGALGHDIYENVIIGSGAGFGPIDNLEGNVIIGFQAAEDILSGYHNVIIGYMAGEGWIDTESNKLVIANTDTATPLIYGDFSTPALTINAPLTLVSGTDINEYSIDGTLGGNSDDALPTEKAVKTYVDTVNPLLENLLTNSGFGVWSQSDANKGLATITYDAGSEQAWAVPSVGDAVVGGTSGAVAKVISYTIATGSFATHDATGVVTVGAVSSDFAFVDNETLTFDGKETVVINMTDGAVQVGLVQNGGFATDTDPPPGWTAKNSTLSTEAGGQVGNCMKILSPAGAAAWAKQDVITEVGKIYKIGGFFKYVSSNTGVSIFVGTSDEGAQYGAPVDDDTTAAWTAWSVTFEATTTTCYLSLRSNCTGVGENDLFDEVYCYEITPCATAGDTVAMDGWIKDSTADIYREHSGANVQDGSFYANKLVVTVAADYVRWPGGIFDNEEWYMQFQGRAVTVGKWVKTSTASHAKLTITDSAGSTSSSFHTGGGAYEWLEVTRTINAAATSVAFYVYGDAAPNVDGSTIIYHCLGMVAFGSAIGEGNYQPKSQEFIWLEKKIPSNVYDGLLTQSDLAYTDLNLEADSDAMLPKGAKIIAAHTEIDDSGSGAGLDVHLQLRKDATAGTFYCNSVAGKPNNVHSHQMGLQPCDVNGDIDIHLDASGGSTFDINSFQYHGVQIN